MEYKPHDYQRRAIRHIIDNDAAGLFLEMGLGKSVITLTAVEQLINKYHDISRVLIIAPKKVAQSTWAQEGAKWDHLKGLRFSLVLGSEKERRAALAVAADIYVTNRENVAWLFEEARAAFDMVIVDEASSFKSPAAKRFKVLKRFRPSFSRVVILTGTPAPQSLMDLWSQVYLLDGGEALGRTLTQYRNRYFLPDKRNGHIVYSYRLREGAHDEIMEAIAGKCLAMRTSDYLELPPRVDNSFYVDLTEKEKSKYEKLKREYVAELDGQELTATNAATLAGKLLQLANGNIYTEGGEYVHFHNHKIEALHEIIEANEGAPVLVFYSYKHDLDGLLKIKGARLLEGPDDVEEWNAGRVPLLLAHPASAAYGLNLQAGGNVVVWYGLTWSLEQYQQANARLHRQGQTRPVIVNHIITRGTMDEAVMAALTRKERGQSALMEALKAEVGK